MQEIREGPDAAERMEAELFARLGPGEFIPVITPALVYGLGEGYLTGGFLVTTEPVTVVAAVVTAAIVSPQPLHEEQQQSRQMAVMMLELMIHRVVFSSMTKGQNLTTVPLVTAFRQ
ncbi:hypothetical protein VE04_07860 [Pseudogymnoascus sp. 24MN13]|nr:hypothetical protein VE04_07860 [Pseudogymnoascus sp. 24MN13]